jgi:hypothetical protein
MHAPGLALLHTKELESMVFTRLLSKLLQWSPSLADLLLRRRAYMQWHAILFKLNDSIKDSI